MRTQNPYSINENKLFKFISNRILGTLYYYAVDSNQENHSSNGVELYTARAPFIVDANNRVLYTHIKKDAPRWKDMGEAVIVRFEVYDAPISGNWYVKNNAVPTWNYAEAEVKGKREFIESKDGILSILEQTVRQSENLSNPKDPWTMDRLPMDYRDILIDYIVGMKIKINPDGLSGYFKLDQQQPTEDQEAVIRGLISNGSPNSLAIAKMMARNLEINL